jgi:glyoxylase-like metal-dependent hydrolase (beta-lactamase superfamily II)
MIRIRVSLLLILLLPALALGQSTNFEVVQLADGVYAAIRKDPPGFAVESNSVFIIGDDNVIVVDAQSNLGTTKEVLAALRKLTNKPVRYVVNTHWHDDHVIGNQVYRDAFPGVDFIAHTNVRPYLLTKGATVRKQWHESGMADFIEQMRSLLKSNKNSAGQPLTEEQRASLASDISLGEGYLTVPADFQPVLPTMAVENQITLYQGTREIEIRYLGRGHTSGDLIVHLPKEHIVVAGDLVVWPIPLVGGDQSHVGDWGATLEKLRALKPTIIVPGHGPLLRDDAYVQQVVRLLNSVKQQTESAVARGETLEQVRKSVDLTELRKIFAGDSKVRNTLFSVYVVGPAVESAFHDATEKR